MISSIVSTKYLRQLQRFTQNRLRNEARVLQVSSSIVPIYSTKDGLGITLNHLVRCYEIVKKIAVSFERKKNFAGAKLIRDAFEFANEAHMGQFRYNGEPYIIHPVAVAEILDSLGCDAVTIVAGLLHDVIEDGFVANYVGGEVQAKRISKGLLIERFGQELADLVDGLTEFGKEPEATVLNPSSIDIHAKILTFATKDIRILLIKLADRLHNMRTLEHMRPEKARKKARETLDVYAPLADRLGIWKIKRELEDLSFRWLDPSKFFEIKRKVAEIVSATREQVEAIAGSVGTCLRETDPNLEIVLEYRFVYETLQRMSLRRGDISTLTPTDVWRVNIIASTRERCFALLDPLAIFAPTSSERNQNYISNPRQNGHQMLQVYGNIPYFGAILFQLRDSEMYRSYNYGVVSNKGLMSNTSWVSDLLRDLVSRVRNVDEDIYRVYARHAQPITVFYNGKPINLRFGSTVLDLASTGGESFLRLKSARIASREVDLSQELKKGDLELKEGDEVSLRYEDRITASPEWFNHITTVEAFLFLQEHFKGLDRRDVLGFVRFILDKKSQKYYLSGEQLVKSKLFKMYVSARGEKGVDSFLWRLGVGRVRLYDVLEDVNGFYLDMKERGRLRYLSYPYLLKTLDSVGLINKLTRSLRKLGMNISFIQTHYSGKNYSGRREIVIRFSTELVNGGKGKSPLAEIQRMQVETITSRIAAATDMEFADIGYKSKFGEPKRKS